jgi:hypothetical protein
MTMIYSKTLCSICTAAALAGFSSLAYAQATRTWVSGVGDDANPCSRTAPCKTFAGAISKTAPGGEINVLDPGGFGAVTITKSISIISDSVEAGVLATGINGINVAAAATDVVVLEGLDFEGLGTGVDGIKITGGGAIFVHKCKIRHFMGNGINVTGNAPTRVVIRDCQILFNGGGVNVQGVGGAPNGAGIHDSLIDANKNFGVQANGANSRVGLFNCFISGSPAAISALNGGGVISFGGNNFISGAGSPSVTLPLR